MTNIYTKPKTIRTEHVKNRKWRNDIKRKYGLTEPEYHQLNESQNYVCAIDHCHTTNKVRGLLCRTCNVAIGYLNDDIALLESAINYLKKQ